MFGGNLLVVCATFGQEFLDLAEPSFFVECQLAGFCEVWVCVP